VRDLVVTGSTSIGPNRAPSQHEHGGCGRSMRASSGGAASQPSAIERVAGRPGAGSPCHTFVALYRQSLSKTDIPTDNLLVHINSSMTVLWSASMTELSFLTNHAQALICIVRDPAVRLRDIAAALGITERSAYAIVTELADAGYVVKERDGRRNRYEIQRHLPLRSSLGAERTIGELLDVLMEARVDVAADPRSHASGAARAPFSRARWRWSPQP
jgi:DNA-binding transcriptional ArsR family regulator